MKKFIVSILILILIPSSSFAADDDLTNAENHKIIGGLYSLAAAVELNAQTNPDFNSLVRFFNKIPAGWQKEIKVERDSNKKTIWVGITVKQYSTARRYLRSHAKELGILEAPGGSAWLGGAIAWLKAADISKKKINSINFSAAEQDGIIFFNAPNSDTWWAAWPNFNSRSIKDILELHGTENQPELIAPKLENETARTSIYDEVKPSSVRVPSGMRMSTTKSSLDMSMEIGDVIFNPIPNTHRR